MAGRGRVFWDVDTQYDFMNKEGALYVPDAELIKPNLKLLTDFALAEGTPMFGSVDRHFGTLEYKAREGELARWGGPFPDHCMDGARGQEKIRETGSKYNSGRDGFDNIKYIEHLLADTKTEEDVMRVQIYSGRLQEAMKTLLERKFGGDPFIFEKQSYDVFTNPAVDFVFENALKIGRVKEAVVYGVATDYCVKAAVLGMQKRGIQTYVVEDAIKGVAPETTKTALEEMLAAGAKFVKTRDVLEGRI